MTTNHLAGRHATDEEHQVARLTAQIAVDQPSLPGALRRSATRICQFADQLQAALTTFRPLEQYLESAVRVVEARTGERVDDELYERLTHRLGVTDIRLALERVAQAHPDVSDTSPAHEARGEAGEPSI